MKILALDLSTKSSGWSIFNDKKLEAYGCITATSTNLYHRIDKMVQEIEILLKENKIEKVIIEEVLLDDVHRNNSVFKALIYLQGFISHLLNKYNLTPEFIVNTSWRAKCGIHTGPKIRREDLKKKDVQFVKDQFGLTVNDDIADAICIGFSAVGGTIKKSQIETTDDGFEFA